MKRVFIFLAEGFEEIEAITPIDVLRRAKIDVTTVSITDKKEVSGAHNITIVTDAIFAETDFSDADLLVLPGGMPGSTNLNEHKALKELLIDFAKKDKLIGAICAAPLVLGGLGLLKGKTATCYPGVEGKLTGAKHTGSPLEVDGNMVTAKGIGAAMKFALQLVAMLKSKDVANTLAEEMVVE